MGGGSESFHADEDEGISLDQPVVSEPQVTTIPTPTVSQPESNPVVSQPTPTPTVSESIPVTPTVSEPLSTTNTPVIS